jgi:hypothetical protein
MLVFEFSAQNIRFLRTLVNGYMTHFYRRTLAASKFWPELWLLHLRDDGMGKENFHPMVSLLLLKHVQTL